MGGLAAVLLKLAVFGIPLAIYFVRRSQDVSAEPDPGARVKREKTLMKEFAPIVMILLLAPLAIVLRIMGLGEWVVYLILGIVAVLALYSLKVRGDVERQERDTK